MIFGSRLRSLCRLSTLGLYFTMEKQEALLRGDTSNTVVDRHFVYALQGLGVHVCGVPEQTSAMILLQVNYVQMAWETLLQLNETNQTRARAQGMVLATHAAILVGFISLAQLHLLEACKIIKKGNFRFLPEYGPSPALSDQVREEISTLTQAIYLENYIYLALNGPAPVRTAGIEREFRLDLRVRVIQCLLAIELEMDLGISSSECTHTCSTYARWPCGPKVFCWSEMRSRFSAPPTVRTF